MKCLPTHPQPTHSIAHKCEHIPPHYHTCDSRTKQSPSTTHPTGADNQGAHHSLGCIHRSTWECTKKHSCQHTPTSTYTTGEHTRSRCTNLRERTCTCTRTRTPPQEHSRAELPVGSDITSAIPVNTIFEGTHGVPSNSTSPVIHTELALGIPHTPCEGPTHTELPCAHSLGFTGRFQGAWHLCCHLPRQTLLEVPAPRTCQSLLSPPKPTVFPSLHMLSPRTRPCPVTHHHSLLYFRLFLSLDSCTD